jgi:Lysozyme like domain
VKELLVLLVAVPVGFLVVFSSALTTFQAPKAPAATPVVVRVPDIPTPIGFVPTVSAFVTDAERFALALAAGWSTVDAITATALSIAEDSSGDPAALSTPNKDGSRDLGLWQINSGWWPSLGGQAALIIPINNARAAYAIYHRQGWCAWSTYATQCGPGHTGSYLSFLCRAQLASGLSGRCN